MFPASLRTPALHTIVIQTQDTACLVRLVSWLKNSQQIDKITTVQVLAPVRDRHRLQELAKLTALQTVVIETGLGGLRLHRELLDFPLSARRLVVRQVMYFAFSRDAFKQETLSLAQSMSADVMELGVTVPGRNSSNTETWTIGVKRIHVTFQ
jgi:hypothetical protein